MSYLVIADASCHMSCRVTQECSVIQNAPYCSSNNVYKFTKIQFESSYIIKLGYTVWSQNKAADLSGVVTEILKMTGEAGPDRVTDVCDADVKDVKISEDWSRVDWPVCIKAREMVRYRKTGVRVDWPVCIKAREMVRYRKTGVELAGQCALRQLRCLGMWLILRYKNVGTYNEGLWDVCEGKC